MEHYNIMSIDTFTILRVSTEESGLEMDIWLDSLGATRYKHKTTPCIYILFDNRWKALPILSEYKLRDNIFSQIYSWINLNQDVLLLHWNNKINDRKVLNLLRRIY